MVVKSIFPYYILEVLLLTFPLGLKRLGTEKGKKKKHLSMSIIFLMSYDIMDLQHKLFLPSAGPGVGRLT